MTNPNTAPLSENKLAGASRAPSFFHGIADSLAATIVEYETKDIYPATRETMERQLALLNQWIVARSRPQDDTSRKGEWLSDELEQRVYEAGGTVKSSLVADLWAVACKMEAALSRPLEAAPVDGGEDYTGPIDPESRRLFNAGFDCALRLSADAAAQVSTKRGIAHPAPAVEGRERVKGLACRIGEQRRELKRLNRLVNTLHHGYSKAVADLSEATGEPIQYHLRLLDGDIEYLRSILLAEAAISQVAPDKGVVEARVAAKPPAGYELLPSGERCKCIKSWTDGRGNFYCCLPTARSTHHA